MKYKEVKKDNPTPGRLTNLKVEINSFVDNPANGRTFLVKKGMDSMDKKVLEDAGLDPEQVSKSLENVTPEQAEKVQSGFIDVIKSVFSFKKPEQKQELTLDSISKMFDEKISKALESKESKKEDVKDEVSEVQKQLDLVNNQIKEESNKNSQLETLQKQLAEKTKELEVIKKAKTGGNGINNEGNNSLSPEIISKQKQEERWANIL